MDLNTLATELRRDDRYQRKGQVARTIVHTPDLRVVLIALAREHTITEHHAGATVTVHCLSGRLRLRLPDRHVDLSAGNLLAMGANLSHDVSAVEDSVFVLTLGAS
ncbi:hypothetical protein DV096_02265 [Bradymonadaceae bacterium TMQ3]|uniref:Cupin domain-containing protein n=1 Tax=Lujinxingia sediminis TaxID=2480984 RepID=A0ABY0CZX6_9DELT|nr:hypothetical protein DV096_02265 [Bradymonadaceae bacterium TMQ3]RVU48995.1 hypothetical protein EA187_03675 [Lujinxingia sediminis]TXC78288.1 hypothetical protein FRC91_03640 [Bradymonadales bacterium TMQ1]